MNKNTLFPTPANVSASWFTPGAVVVALCAAMTLAACGPRDETPLAGGAPGSTEALASAQPAPTASMVEPSPQQAGQPVPPISGQVAAVAPAPAFATQPQPSYPADPAPPATRYQPAPVPVAPPQRVAGNRAGEIASIEPIRSRPEGSGAGAVIGGVLGAVVGNQFGHGLGRAAMTGAGVVGGAVAGNNIERNHKEGVSGYRVSIRLDNGNTRTFERQEIGSLHVGDRVRLDANSFHRG
jgi:outer membrane lipoprotein SlyB